MVRVPGDRGEKMEHVCSCLCRLVRGQGHCGKRGLTSAPPGLIVSPHCTPVPRTPAPTPPAPLWLLFQVLVEGPTSSVELHNLTAGTEYLVSVFPVCEAGVGESLRGLVTTGGWGGAGRGFPGCPTQSLPLEPPASRGVQRPLGLSPPAV